MFKSLHLNVKIRLLECFLSSLLGCMVLPFMVIYYAQHFGEVLSGIFSATNIIIGAIAGFYGGHLADGLGRRKLLMVAALVQSLLFLIMAASNYLVEWPIVTLLCSTGTAILFGLSAPAASAMIIDATNEDNRKFVYGIEYWLFNVAFLIGNLVGGLAFLKYKCLLMFLLCVGEICSFLFLLLFIKELHVCNNDKKKNIFANYWKIFQDKSFVLFSFGIMLICSIEFQVRNYITVKFSANDELFKFSVIMSENTALVAILGLFSTYFISNMNSKKALYYGSLIFLIALSLIAGISDIWLLVFVMAFATIGELIMVPASQSIMASMIPNEDRGSYMAARSLIGRFGGVLGGFAVTIGHFFNSWQMVIIFISIGLFGFLLTVLSFQSKIGKSNA